MSGAGPTSCSTASLDQSSQSVNIAGTEEYRQSTLLRSNSGDQMYIDFDDLVLPRIPGQGKEPKEAEEGTFLYALRNPYTDEQIVTSYKELADIHAANGGHRGLKYLDLYPGQCCSGSQHSVAPSCDTVNRYISTDRGRSAVDTMGFKGVPWDRLSLCLDDQNWNALEEMSSGVADVKVSVQFQYTKSSANNPSDTEAPESVGATEELGHDYVII